MTDQIKYLLVPLALSLMAGCGEREANSPGADLPESQKTPYEKLVSGGI